jgi:hypothetical protein
MSGKLMVSNQSWNAATLIPTFESTLMSKLGQLPFRTPVRKFSADTMVDGMFETSQAMNDSK